jgi:hypothetical protein
MFSIFLYVFLDLILPNKPVTLSPSQDNENRGMYTLFNHCWLLVYDDGIFTVTLGTSEYKTI